MGSLDDPEQSLVAVGDVRIGGDGRLYVVQSQDDQFRIYGPDGALEARVGGSGEGPGEFGSIAGLGLRGDTVLVSDRSLDRVSYFGPDGAFLDSRQWPSERVRSGVMFLSIDPPVVLLPDGSGLSGLMDPQMGFAGPGPADGARTLTLDRGYFRVREESPPDTVVAYQRSTSSNRVPVPGADPVRIECPVTTSPLGRLMADGSGAVLVDRTPPPALGPSAFRVTRFGPAGDTAFSAEVPYDPVPLTDEVVRAEIEEIRGRYESAERPVPTAGAIEASLEEIECFPVAREAVTDLVTAQDGTIWVRREERGAATVAWDVLAGADGVRIGRLHLPAAEEVAAVRGDVLVTSWADDLGVPYLTRYRLIR